MFYKNITKKDGYKNECKPCNEFGRKQRYSANRVKMAARSRAWRNDNKERMNMLKRIKYAKDPTAMKSSHLKWKYGITIEQYDVMLDEQGGLCAICKREENRKPLRRLAVDHCHSTGKIRGLLCSRCNTAIGQFCDNPEIMKSAMSYVERYSS